MRRWALALAALRRGRRALPVLAAQQTPAMEQGEIRRLTALTASLDAVIASQRQSIDALAGECEATRARAEQAEADARKAEAEVADRDGKIDRLARALRDAEASLAAALEERPLADGTYAHLVYCNGDRRQPAGMRGVACNCKVGIARAKQIEAERDRAQEEVATLRAERQRETAILNDALSKAEEARLTWEGMAAAAARLTGEEMRERIARAIFEHEGGCTREEDVQLKGKERPLWALPAGVTVSAAHDPSLAQWQRDDYRFQADAVLSLLRKEGSR